MTEKDSVNFESDSRIMQQDESYLEAHFDKRTDPYVVIPANTPELLKIYAQMRYLVFCEEHPEFNEKKRINQLEYDRYDGHALHFLVMYQPLHMVIGGMRIILPQKDQPHFGFPSLEIEDSPLRNGFAHDLLQFCEISRFLLVKERLKMIRAHQSEGGRGKNHPDILHHMVRAIVSVCNHYKFKGFFGAMEDALFRRWKLFFGMTMTKQGQPFEHHGKRQIGYILIEEGMKEVKEVHVRFYHFLRESLSIDF